MKNGKGVMGTTESKFVKENHPVEDKNDLLKGKIEALRNGAPKMVSQQIPGLR